MDDDPPRSQPARPAASARPLDTDAATWAVGEQLACDHLVNLGFEVVARNWRTSIGRVRGELDVVALDHERCHVVVVEVKTRRGAGFGGALAAVDRRKRDRLRRLATAFLVEAALPYREVRFDVIGVRLDTRHLHHVMDAL